MAAVALAFPLAIRARGGLPPGSSYLAWQLFRKPNHPLDFYLTTVPVRDRPGCRRVRALGGLVVDRQTWTGGSGCCARGPIAPIVFFTLTPVKGFQYLLPVAPVAAVLAARALTAPGHVGPAVAATVPADRRARCRRESWSRWSSSACVVPTLGQRAARPPAGGSSPVPAACPAAGRPGTWIGANVPEGATLLTIGPSMANIVAVLRPPRRPTGSRSARTRSTATRPTTPVDNPDLQLRNGSIQYVVWDSFSAGRSPSFSRRLLAYVAKYHGVVDPHPDRDRAGGRTARPTRQPVIIVYEVRP